MAQALADGMNRVAAAVGYVTLIHLAGAGIVRLVGRYRRRHDRLEMVDGSPFGQRPKKRRWF